jgi:AcrR family transcriptional regulator
MLTSAARIIWTDGPASCTVDEVARQSGVAKTTIYRHFRSSDELVLAVVDRDVKDSEGPDTGSLRGDLTAILSHYLSVAESVQNRRLFSWMLSRSLVDPDFAAMFRKVRVQPRGPTVLALQRAIGRGELDPNVDIDIAMHFVQGPLLGKRIIDNETPTTQELAMVIDLIVGGLLSLGHRDAPVKPRTSDRPGSDDGTV